MNTREIASAMGIALKYHVIGLERIVQWADEEIAARERPDINIIELSLAKTDSEAITWLNNLGGSSNKKVVTSVCFSYLYDALKTHEATVGDVSKCLYFLALADYEPEEGVGGDMMFFWDGIELAERGYLAKNVTEVKDDMLKLLEQYRA